MSTDIPEHREVRTGDDPTKALLSQSGLNSKFLCDYVVNVATGCRHGCKFCYVPATPNIRTRPEMLENTVGVMDGQEEWGSYVLYRDELGEKLDKHLERKRTWKSTEKGCGIVGVSFSTDCYMDGRAGAITRDVVEALTSHNRYTRVLTRNPILALQDLDVFQSAGDYVTVGSSVPCLDSDLVKSIEPKAPAPTHRLRGLEQFDEAGVNTYVSMSPTYPTQSREDLEHLLQRIAEVNPDVVFHEPINPRLGNFQMCVEAARDRGDDELANELEGLRKEDVWVEYAVDHLRAVQELGQELELPVHLWPDKQLVSLTSGSVSEWLAAWRERQSPERFAERKPPRSELPEVPGQAT